MKPLELYYPCKPLGFNQRFGNPDSKYLSIGVPSGRHNGIDFYAPDGTVICATHDGEVTFTGEDGSGGLGVVVRTLEKFDYKGKPTYFKTIYWHIKRGTFKVRPGQRVVVGDVLAYADNTGFSTGSHLHFGLKPILKGEKDWEWYNLEPDNGYNGAIDPEPYFNGKFAFDVKLSWIYRSLSELAKSISVLARQKKG